MPCAPAGETRRRVEPALGLELRREQRRRHLLGARGARDQRAHRRGHVAGDGELVSLARRGDDRLAGCGRRPSSRRRRAARRARARRGAAPRPRVPARPRGRRDAPDRPTNTRSPGSRPAPRGHATGETLQSGRVQAAHRVPGGRERVVDEARAVESALGAALAAPDVRPAELRERRRDDGAGGIQAADVGEPEALRGDRLTEADAGARRRRAVLCESSRTCTRTASGDGSRGPRSNSIATSVAPSRSATRSAAARAARSVARAPRGTRRRRRRRRRSAARGRPPPPARRHRPSRAGARRAASPRPATRPAPATRARTRSSATAPIATAPRSLRGLTRDPERAASRGGRARAAAAGRRRPLGTSISSLPPRTLARACPAGLRRAPQPAPAARARRPPGPARPRARPRAAARNASASCANTSTASASTGARTASSTAACPASPAHHRSSAPTLSAGKREHARHGERDRDGAIGPHAHADAARERAGQRRAHRGARGCAARDRARTGARGTLGGDGAEREQARLCQRCHQEQQARQQRDQLHPRLSSLRRHGMEARAASVTGLWRTVTGESR